MKSRKYIVASLLIASILATVGLLHANARVGNSKSLTISVDTNAMATEGDINGIHYSACKSMLLSNNCHMTDGEIQILTPAPIVVKEIRLERNKSILNIKLKYGSNGICKRTLTLPKDLAKNADVITIEIGISEVAKFEIHNSTCTPI